MEKIVIDIYSFSKLRKNGCASVNKMDALYAKASGDVGLSFASERCIIIKNFVEGMLGQYI